MAGHVTKGELTGLPASVTTRGLLWAKSHASGSINVGFAANPSLNRPDNLSYPTPPAGMLDAVNVRHTSDSFRGVDLRADIKTHVLGGNYAPSAAGLARGVPTALNGYPRQFYIQTQMRCDSNSPSDPYDRGDSQKHWPGVAGKSGGGTTGIASDGDGDVGGTSWSLRFLPSRNSQGAYVLKDYCYTRGAAGGGTIPVGGGIGRGGSSTLVQPGAGNVPWSIGETYDVECGINTVDRWIRWYIRRQGGAWFLALTRTNVDFIGIPISLLFMSCFMGGSVNTSNPAQFTTHGPIYTDDEYIGELGGAPPPADLLIGSQEPGDGDLAIDLTPGKTFTCGPFTTPANGASNPDIGYIGDGLGPGGTATSVAAQAAAEATPGGAATTYTCTPPSVPSTSGTGLLVLAGRRYSAKVISSCVQANGPALAAWASMIEAPSDVIGSYIMGCAAGDGGSGEDRAPQSGSNIVTTTWSGSTHAELAAVAFTGLSLTNPYDPVTGVEVSSGATQGEITATPPVGGMLVAVISTQTKATALALALGTAIFNRTGASFANDAGAAGAYIAGDGTAKTIRWTWSGGQAFSIAAVILHPGIGGGVKTQTVHAEVHEQVAGAPGTRLATRSFTVVEGAAETVYQDVLTWALASYGALPIYLALRGGTVSSGSTPIARAFRIPDRGVEYREFTAPGDFDLEGDTPTLSNDDLLGAFIEYQTASGVAPTVTATTPAAGATGVNIAVAPTVTFSLPMSPATITSSTVRVKVGGTPVAGTTTLSGDGLTATITPSAALATSTVHTIEVTTGAQAAGGTPIAATFTATFTTAAAADTTRPTISSVSPANLATGVALTAPVLITFSEAMDPATLTTTSITVRPVGGAALSADLALSAGNTIATLTPASPLTFGAVYEVRVTTAVADIAGNTLLTQSSTTFTALTDTTPPVPATGLALTRTSAGAINVAYTASASSDLATDKVRVKDGAGQTFSSHADGTELIAETARTPSAPVSRDVGSLAEGDVRSIAVFSKDAAGNWDAGTTATISLDGFVEYAQAAEASLAVVLAAKQVLLGAARVSGVRGDLDLAASEVQFIEQALVELARATSLWERLS